MGWNDALMYEDAGYPAESEDTMEKHTPGPWTVGAVAPDVVLGPQKQGIASLARMENAEANAHLIAQAPALLAVVQEFMAVGFRNYSGVEFARIREAARSALQAATQKGA